MPEPSEENQANIDIKSILLLDDDVTLAQTLQQLLEAHNFVVTTVGSGVEGLQEVMRFDFDVIICDMMMPHMPGDMFYRAVERTKPHLCPRFLFITGHPDKEEVLSFLTGIEDAVVLHKPVRKDELIQEISEVLKRNGAL